MPKRCVVCFIFIIETLIFYNNKSQIKLLSIVCFYNNILIKINKRKEIKIDVSCSNIKDDTSYELTTNNHKITMINHIDVNKVYNDLFKKLMKE